MMWHRQSDDSCYNSLCDNSDMLHECLFGKTRIYTQGLGSFKNVHEYPSRQKYIVRTDELILFNSLKSN